MKIKGLKANTNASIDKAEVIEAGEIRTFNKPTGAGRVRTLKLKDDTGEVELTLWNDDVENFSEGDTLKLTECWVKEWNGKVQISAGKNGKIEKL